MPKDKQQVYVYWSLSSSLSDSLIRASLRAVFVWWLLLVCVARRFLSTTIESQRGSWPYRSLCLQNVRRVHLQGKEVQRSKGNSSRGRVLRYQGTIIPIVYARDSWTDVRYVQIFRFYIKCTQCSAEITFKTDPKFVSFLSYSFAAFWLLMCSEIQELGLQCWTWSSTKFRTLAKRRGREGDWQAWPARGGGSESEQPHGGTREQSDRFKTRDGYPRRLAEYQE